MDARLRKSLVSLGITDQHLLVYKLPPSAEPDLSQLEVVEIDHEGRPFVLERRAAVAWRAMKSDAAGAGIRLIPISGFRSYAYQALLFSNLLALGNSLEKVLSEAAIPGFSEHHTGRAIDISFDENYELDQTFESTAAYEWLTLNAGRFGFRLSYPRGNEQGIVFEPWHWFFLGA